MLRFDHVRLELVRVFRLSIAFAVILQACANAAEPPVIVHLHIPRGIPYGNVASLTKALNTAGVEQFQISIAKRKVIYAEVQAPADLPFADIVKVVEILRKAGVDPITLTSTFKSKVKWRDYSAKDLKTLRSEREPVLVFCRADWCLTCRALDDTLFSDEQVLQAIKHQGFTTLRADHTKPSEETKKFLETVKSKPVPSVVIYPTSKKAIPVVLTGEISKDELLRVLASSGKRPEKQD